MAQPSAPAVAADPAFLGMRGVSDVTSLSAATIWRLAREGKFPAPLKLEHPRRTVWVEDEVRGWVADAIKRARRRPPDTSTAIEAAP